MPSDIRTKAIVLRRTKYGETDRILNLLTPEGHFSVLAKGVRKEKSRLAGGIEMFCVSDVVIHQGRGNLSTLTSAKMLTFYQNLLTDLASLELASQFLKQINRVSMQVDSPELFSLVEQCFSGLHNGLDHRLVESWFLFNLARISGEEANLHFDVAGEKLSQDAAYTWDSIERALSLQDQGNITSDHIKFMRLLHVAELAVAARVKNYDIFLDDISYIAKSL